MVTSDFRPEVEIQPFRACAMHQAIIGTVRSLWTWLWGTYHVPQNEFLVYLNNYLLMLICTDVAGYFCPNPWLGWDKNSHQTEFSLFNIYLYSP